MFYLYIIFTEYYTINKTGMGMSEIFSSAGEDNEVLQH